MTDTNYVACDEFYWHRQNGSKTRISWRAGTPYYSDGRWICSSYLDGVDDRPFKNYGASAMQALLLRAAHGYFKIARLIQRGDVISGVDEEAEEISLQELTELYFPLCNPGRLAAEPA